MISTPHLAFGGLTDFLLGVIVGFFAGILIVLVLIGIGRWGDGGKK